MIFKNVDELEDYLGERWSITGVIPKKVQVYPSLIHASNTRMISEINGDDSYIYESSYGTVEVEIVSNSQAKRINTLSKSRDLKETLKTFI